MAAGNKRILVIDDDLEIWKAYKAVLEPERVASVGAQQKLGRLLSMDPEEDLDSEPRSDSTPVFQVRFAAQGQEGYALVQEAISESMSFAVAFIDIRMPPGWDGMETAARIRQIDPNIEMVIVTAYSDRSRHEISSTVGSPEKLLFLRKPFDPEELTQMALSLTEKWNLARKEEAQRRELRTVLRTTPAAIFTVDANRRINSWNPSAERITGYSAEEVIGKPCVFKKMDDHVCGDCPMDTRSYLDKSHESTITDKSGRKRIISKSISYIRDGSGHVIHAVESFWDITARKEAEAALRESELRFRSLVETTSDWVWEIDAEGRFTYCSPLCEMIYGYTPDELLGKSMFDVLIAPEEIDHCGEVLNRCIRDVCSFQVVERRSIRKDGNPIHIEFSGAPVIGEDGEVAGFRGIDRDITERKRIEEERARLEEHYRQSRKMEALGTLAGGIAHDLNNILTPIIGNAQLCLLDMDPSHACYSKLQDIVKSAEKAADLIRQILAFSRKQMLVPSTLDLNRMIADFTKMLRRLIREDIELKLDLADDLWPVDADSSQMGQILINLVVNARDAIPGGGVITIQTRNKIIADGPGVDVESTLAAILQPPPSGYYVVMAINDNGMGMDEETLARIYDPFFTTKEAGKGTGLGLSTVYGIVNQHEGHIQVESKPNRGATFSIYFKRTEKEIETLDEVKSIQVNRGKETILLAEDNKDVRMLTVSALEYYGYRVLTASSGTEAIRVFNEYGGGIDLLLTDVVMPGFRGEAVAQNLRVKQPGLPIIFMSGHPFDVAPSELEKTKHTSFIQKPFKPQTIARKVREMLDRHKSK